MANTVPASAIIPTIDRVDAFARTLESIALQSALPEELIVIDASKNEATARVCENPPQALRGRIVYRKAIAKGAAQQRNQGIAEARQAVIWFMDDDILLEPECVARLYAALTCDKSVGGANAMITNQHYGAPGRFSKLVFAMLDGRVRPTYSGRCLGPGLMLLPEDSDDLPEVVEVDWLNAGCTMYRREVLPEPVFDEFFQGYSLGEDGTLSLRVGRNWKLVNARTARIYHDSQPGDHKRSAVSLSEMELVNRHYIMTHVLGRRRAADYARLSLLQLFHLAAELRTSSGRRRAPATLWGKVRGLVTIMRGSRVKTLPPKSRTLAF